MLSIGKLGQGQEAYYVETVAKGAEEYYLGQGEAVGRWLGRSAARLGLEGDVDGGDLRALLAHADPHTGRALAGGRSAPKVAGFDMTFCAPKSVSLLWAFGDDDVARHVVEAHEAAVAAAFAVLEVEAARVRRGHGGATSLEADGLVAGTFRHRTSRAGDPHLHTHVVVANIGYCGEDGRWTALDARHLYRWAQPVGYLYATHLRFELGQRLGLEWGPVKNGLADIAGVPRPLIDMFSTRRREILEHLAAHDAAGGRAAQVATYATRRPKQPSAEAVTMQSRWRDAALAAGHDPSVVTDRVGRADEPREVVLDALVVDLAGRIGLTARRSSFDRRDVLKAVCDRLPDGATVEAVELFADRFLASDHVVPLGDTEPASRWSTVDLLATERRLIEHALRGRRAVSTAGRVPEGILRAALDRHPDLCAEQVHMVERLCSSGHGVELVIGAAGSGKTSALIAAREAWQEHGWTVVGCALAARAAQQLHDGAGIESSTLDSLLRRVYDISPSHVVVVDEAGMVGTRQLETLAAQTARVGAKLVLVGDPHQLPAIDAGGAMAALSRRLGAIELVENHRQNEEWERQLLAELRVGQTTHVVAALDAHGRIDESASVEDVIERWLDARDRTDDVLLLAGRRDQVTALNQEARRRLQATGEVGPDQVRVGGRAFAEGDEVVALRNDRELGVLNGTRGTIVGIRVDEFELDLDDGRRLDLPLRYAEDGHLDHGYALTIHKAQGLTADETIVLADDVLAREHAYVALSRGRSSNRIAVAPHLEDDPVPPDSRSGPAQRLRPILERSAAEDFGIDL